MKLFKLKNLQEKFIRFKNFYVKKIHLFGFFIIKHKTFIRVVFIVLVFIVIFTFSVGGCRAVELDMAVIKSNLGAFDQSFPNSFDDWFNKLNFEQKLCYKLNHWNRTRDKFVSISLPHYSFDLKNNYFDGTNNLYLIPNSLRELQAEILMSPSLPKFFQDFKSKTINSTAVDRLLRNPLPSCYYEIISDRNLGEVQRKMSLKLMSSKTVSSYYHPQFTHNLFHSSLIHDVLLLFNQTNYIIDNKDSTSQNIVYLMFLRLFLLGSFGPIPMLTWNLFAKTMSTSYRGAV